VNDDVVRAPTLPSQLPVSLIAWDSESNARDFGEMLLGLLGELSCSLDLERLAGVTATYDFEQGFALIERGFDATPITYTATEELRCVAKCIPVLREGRPMQHVVYHAPFIEDLAADADTDAFLDALHILAHECGHVVELKWRDEAFPGTTLRERYDSHVDALLLGTADIAWSEYAACRLTAQWSRQTMLRDRYAETLATHVGLAWPQARAAILEFRRHGDIARVLTEAGQPLCEPLRLAGYLFGHLDGMGDDSAVTTLCPGLEGASILPLLERCRTHLRAMWDTRGQWTTTEATFAPLRQVAQDAMASGGIFFDPMPEGGYYVRIPFTAETFEGGAVGLWLAQLRATGEQGDA
jgi:hypothetical protein